MNEQITAGRYRLLRRIAAGGMAEVYIAELEGARGVVRRCIVKRILPTLATREEFSKAFIDEARIGARLSHPNLVTTLDFSEIDQNLFLALEYVDGPDLGRLCEALAKRGERMPIEVATTVIAGVLRGLAYAHAAADEAGRPLRIVHRDVNPPNILISLSGAVKLADFGIAHAASRLTTTRFGHLKGKIPYMSPEQAEGRPVDARSDLFSCGIVLYELLTGGQLFAGAEEMEVLRLVREASITPPMTFRQEVSPELDAVCMKALARNRDDRYGSAEAFLADLEKCRASAFPDFCAEDLARFVNDRAQHWAHVHAVRQKTAVLDGDDGIEPGVQEREPAKRRSRAAKAGLIAGAALSSICIAAAVLWFAFGTDAAKTGRKTAPFVPSGTIEVSGGARGAFVLLDGMLVGRVPILADVTAEKKSHSLKVFKQGYNGLDVHLTVTPDSKRFVDLRKRMLRGAGTVLFDPRVPQGLRIDGREAQIEGGTLFVEAGEHRLTWPAKSGLVERFVQVLPGQSAVVEIP